MELDMDLASPSSFPAFFYPPGEASQTDDFVHPTAITNQEEAQANIRFYPGMHREQAALAKGRAQAQQQRRQQLIQQQQKRREEQARPNQRRSAPHEPVDLRTEEAIARVVNQIRLDSSMSAGADSMSRCDHVDRRGSGRSGIRQSIGPKNSSPSGPATPQGERPPATQLALNKRSSVGEYIGFKFMFKVTKNVHIQPGIASFPLTHSQDSKDHGLRMDVLSELRERDDPEDTVGLLVENMSDNPGPLFGTPSWEWVEARERTWVWRPFACGINRDEERLREMSPSLWRLMFRS